MFFTNTAFVLAWLFFIPSLLGYCTIMIVLWTDSLLAATEIFGSRFLASSRTFVEGIAVGVAFGVAAEISAAIAKRE